MIKEPIPLLPDSPCVRNCCLNEQDICMGCGRTLEEILAWGGASQKLRDEIMQRSITRKEKLNHR